MSSCYTAALSGVLRRARLPVRSLAVKATGTVTGFPASARFARIVVTPTVLGGDPARQDEYEAAADAAHDRCFIGRTLTPDVAYEVGAIEVRAGDEPPTLEDADGRPSVWRAA